MFNFVNGLIGEMKENFLSFIMMSMGKLIAFATTTGVVLETVTPVTVPIYNWLKIVLVLITMIFFIYRIIYYRNKDKREQEAHDKEFKRDVNNN